MSYAAYSLSQIKRPPIPQQAQQLRQRHLHAPRCERYSCPRTHSYVTTSNNETCCVSRPKALFLSHTWLSPPFCFYMLSMGQHMAATTC